MNRRTTVRLLLRVCLLLAAGAIVALGSAGCSEYRPRDYGNARPPIDRIDKRDKGLQSKDVVAASDQMAQDLLAVPEVAGSDTRLLVVVDRVENRTQNARFDLDIFLERLRVKLAQLGRGKVQLIENRDKLRDLQSRELEGAGEREDAFGQRGITARPGPAGVQPDYSLYGRISELPNRGTSYYFAEFTLTDLRTREQVWSNAYEVKVER